MRSRILLAISPIDKKIPYQLIGPISTTPHQRLQIEVEQPLSGNSRGYGSWHQFSRMKTRGTLATFSTYQAIDAMVLMVIRVTLLLAHRLSLFGNIRGTECASGYQVGIYPEFIKGSTRLPPRTSFQPPKATIFHLSRRDFLLLCRPMNKYQRKRFPRSHHRYEEN